MSTGTDAPPDTAQPDQGPPDDPQAATPTGRVVGERGPLATFMRYAGMPAFLGAVLLALFAYVQGQELDSIEARTLVPDIIQARLTEHIFLTFMSTLIVLALAIPLGILVTRPGTRRLAPAIIGLGNAGQAIPSLGLMALLFYAFRQIDALPSTGNVVVITALVAYSFLPILRNTMVGLEQVDRAVLESGRGMGMSNGLVLRRLELPLAVPVILAGVRTALILNVGTAALAFLFGGGGLGELIFSGFQLRRTPILLTGAVLTGVLALALDYLAGVMEERLTPQGLQR